MDFAACVDKVGYGLSGVGRVQLHLTLYLVISQTQRHDIDRLASPLGFQLKCKLCHGNIMWWQSKSCPIPNLPQLMKMVSIGRRRYKPQQIIFVMREYHWNLSVFLLFTYFGSAAAQALLNIVVCMLQPLIDKWSRGTQGTSPFIAHLLVWESFHSLLCELIPQYTP